jgi:hypothetical protein
VIRSAAVESWGSTAAERAASYPCDARIESPDRALFRAVDVAAPAELLYRWLCQIRVAPYSYDWIDNLGRRSPQHLIDGLDELEVGQRFSFIFRLTAFEQDRSITLESTTPYFGHVAMTYVAAPQGPETSRLVAKIAFAAPGGLVGIAARRVLPAGDLVMMRKQLLTLRDLAERDAREGPVATTPR